MGQLDTIQLILVGLVFIWSGFVRSGLGFGGTVLALPFLLLIHNDPLLFMPLMAIQLLIFSSWMAITNYRKLNRHSSTGEKVSTVDWRYLKYAMAIMIVPKIVGVFGLLTMPPKIMTTIIFVVVFVYAVGYVLNRPFQSNNKYLDCVFLILGGYVSGTSLIGEPLIVAVFASHVSKEKLRDTLFVLWFILVLIKVLGLGLAGIDFNWSEHLWLLPLVTIGHFLGLQFHKNIVDASTPIFYRMVGSVLLLISILGLYKAWFA